MGHIRAVMARSSSWPVLALLAACGGEDLQLESRIRESVTVEIRAPAAGLAGPCDVRFDERFCREELEGVGSITIRGGDRRTITLDDDFDETCSNVLWLRLIRLDEVGPVADPGTLFELPASAEIEYGAGAAHTVAFPQATIRLDEVGRADAHQAGPPLSCAELGRTPRPR